MPRVLAGVRIWDGEAGAYLRDVDALRVEAGRIAAIGRSGELAVGARVLRLDGAALIPGLIDAHVHLDLDPALATPEAQAAVPGGRAERALEERALAMLRAGITSARDLGGGAWREIALRDRIAAGVLPGPRLLCAGQPVTRPGGHCWFWGGTAADAGEIGRVIARQVEHGTDWIKLIASGGRITAGTAAHVAQFDVEALAHAVRSARLHGRPTAAHSHATAGIRNAAAAGVQSIEHCSFAGPAGFGTDFDPRAAEQLAARGIFVSATVNAGWARHFDARGALRPFAERMARIFRELRRAGVRIVASTDAGIPGVAHDGLPRALAVFARIAGLTPPEVLRTATSQAADALGLAQTTGRLRPGLTADVLAVAGDPLRDLGCLAAPLLVLAGALPELPAGGRASPGGGAPIGGA